MNRREFQFLGAAAAIVGTTRFTNAMTGVADAKKRKFTIDLCPGRIGVNGSQQAIIDFAAKYGFESVEPFGESIESMSTQERAEVTAGLGKKKLVWGAAGLPVEFRRSEEEFKTGLGALPGIATALQTVGVTRMGTWISSFSDEYTSMTNFRMHAKRLGEAASVLGDHGLRLGLEYVGPKTLWTSKRYPFIHTLNETLELIAEIGRDNVGIVLDSWHWYTAAEDIATLQQLKNEQIVAVDLNDAPTGIDRDQQMDQVRELPAATGVIDVKTFLQFLIDVGYDGPVRAEPFNRVLNEMGDDDAVQATATAMKKAINSVAS